MFRTLSKAVALSIALVGSAHAADSYPRLATYAISSPHDYWDPAYYQKLAKLNVAILTIYPGWGSSRDTNMNEVVGKIKAINPNTRVFVYVQPESMPIPHADVWDSLENKVNSQKWWLYPTGTSGSPVGASFAGHYVLNISPTSTTDSSGKTFGKWFASYVVSQFGTPNPNLSGLYSDNIFWAPRKDGDWNRDGRTDSHSDPTVQKNYRTGMRQYIDAVKSAMPGKLQLANVADWGLPDSVITEYQGAFHGGIIEGMVGKTWSLETSQGWKAMMTMYRKNMAAFASPKLGICVQTGALSDYQAMRYGLASCSMDDGYYAYSNVADTYHGVPWFDEFNADLGAAASGPVTQAWQSGVYRRDFENGIVLVNPKGNGARTVTLEADFVKLKGSQDSTVNNGATVRTVTLKDRDGIFLMRKSRVAAPEAPTSFQVN